MDDASQELLIAAQSKTRRLLMELSAQRDELLCGLHPAFADAGQPLMDQALASLGVTLDLLNQATNPADSKQRKEKD